MQPRRGDAVGDREVELEAPADGTSGWRVPGCTLRRPSKVNSGPSVPADRPSVPVLDLAGEQFADARPVRDEAALAELAAAHDQQAAVDIDVVEAQPARLAGAQPQAVAESEDGAVGRAAPSARGLSGSAAAASSSRRAWATSNRNGRRRPVSRRCGSAQRRDLQQLLGDGPVEEAADDADEVVEAARPRPRPGRHELSSSARVSWSRSVDAVLVGEADQQPQLASSCRYLRPERPLVGEEARRRRRQGCRSSQHLLAVAEGDLAQRLDGDLGVDLGRPRRAVADEVADGLQVEVGIDQALHAEWRSVCEPGRGTSTPALSR